MNMFLKTGALGLALAGVAQTSLAKELKLDDLFPRDRFLGDQRHHRGELGHPALPAAHPRKRPATEPPNSTAALPYSCIEADVSIEGVTYKNVGIRKKDSSARRTPPAHRSG